MTTVLARLRQRVQQELDNGAIPSCQFAFARDGELLHQETIGAGDDARYTIFSATKPMVASVIWQLVTEGHLAFEAPIATWWPEFASQGKDAVTLDHVLLHTCGFPNATLDSEADRTTRALQMADWHLEWEPGSRFEYHALSAHWVLAELITRVTGQDHRAALRERVLDPLGLDRLELGVPVERQGDVQPLVKTGCFPTPEEIHAVLGVDTLDLGVNPIDLFAFNDPAFRAAGVPGGGGVSDAGSVALFYQALLHDPKGLWDPHILSDVTSNARNDLPAPLAGSAMRSRGFELVGSGPGALFRPGSGATSARTFGHGGAAGQIAWADPESGLSFAFLTNGSDQHFIREFTRTAELSALAAQV